MADLKFGTIGRAIVGSFTASTVVGVVLSRAFNEASPGAIMRYALLPPLINVTLGTVGYMWILFEHNENEQARTNALQNVKSLTIYTTAPLLALSSWTALVYTFSV